MQVRTWASIVGVLGQRYTPPNGQNGPTNPQSKIRLFGTNGEPEVTLYRDFHAWCPYCQKVWLFLEEKQIPYRVQKVTMFCYGDKEPWYTRIVPSGMLPALELRGVGVISESDEILHALEGRYGPLGQSLDDPEVVVNRKLERRLFRSWCQWLCSQHDDSLARKRFMKTCAELEARISESSSPYFLSEFGISDVIFTPFLERATASLFYYKGFNLREEFPVLDAWFGAMETRETYRGTKSDFHTHVHDLPPQMGSCYFSPDRDAAAQRRTALVDRRDAATFEEGVAPEVSRSDWPEPETALLEAAYRTAKHREAVMKVSPAGADASDLAIRLCLTKVLGGTGGAAAEEVQELPKDLPLEGMVEALRYMRDRISVPRDMSLWAGLRYRALLEDTAQELEKALGRTVPNKHPIALKHRRETNPYQFPSAAEL